MAEKRNRLLQAFDLLFNRKPEQRAVYTTPTNSLGLPYGSYSGPVAVNNSMQLSTVYRCVEVISDAIASEPWEVLEYSKSGWRNNEFNPIAYMLNYEPNILYSPFTVMKTLVARVLLWGNGYLRIIRNGVGEPVKLELISVEVKRFLRPDGTCYYQIGPDHEQFIEQDYNIIHIMGHSQNGLIGHSVIQHAVLSLELAVSSEASAKGFFSSGANMAGILQVEGKLTKEKAKKIKDSWSAAFDVTTGEPGGIAVIEGGLNFNPVRIPPKDAQMLESRKFNVVEICRFFGVSPAKVFDDSNLTYSNIESFQLAFLTDTISPLNCKIESEFNKKLLRPSKRLTARLNLNIEGLMKADLNSKANYISKMFQAGGYTVNEVRRQAGNPSVDGGDKAFIQVNMQPVDKLIENTKTNNNGKQGNTEL